jgi:ATP-binding protein involved in chromosome partitioning
MASPAPRPPLQKGTVTQILAEVSAPGTEADLLSAGTVLEIGIGPGEVHLRIQLKAEPPELQGLAERIHSALRAAADGQGQEYRGLTIDFLTEQGDMVQQVKLPADMARSEQRAAAAATGGGHRPIGGLQPTPQGQAPTSEWAKYIIAVGAGKGGVGKSAVAANLAVGLARRGHAVGLLDGDIYGPSMPTMLGLHGYDQAVVRGRLQPFYVHGIKAITIGKLVDTDKPLIWRGPMAHGAFKQLVEQTDWGELEYLIIDLPPGTGDIALTMAQFLKLTGAVVVCTPQQVAQDDAIRAAKMFQQLGIEVLGVVENMSFFVGDDGKEYDIFGKGGAERMAANLNLPFLGAIPITMALRENSDRGEPAANFKGDTALRRALETLVDNVEKQVALAAIRQGASRPELKIH